MRCQHVLIAAVVFTGTILAQQAAPPSGRAIPNYIAFRLFFAAAAVNPSASSNESARQDALLNPVQLTPADRSVLVGALASFSTNLATAQVASQGTSLDAVAQSTILQLTGKMSQDGFMRLYA